MDYTFVKGQFTEAQMESAIIALFEQQGYDYVHGESIHIAKTLGVHEAESHDAALAAARFLVAERELMDRLGAEEPCICKFGLVEAGTVCNAVAGEAHLAGSLRVFTDSMLDRARAGIRRALEEA